MKRTKVYQPHGKTIPQKAYRREFLERTTLEMYYHFPLEVTKKLQTYDHIYQWEVARRTYGN